jgi:short-subunit dehydrogenase
VSPDKYLSGQKYFHWGLLAHPVVWGGLLLNCLLPNRMWQKIYAFSKTQIKFENEKVESHQIDIQSEHNIQEALDAIGDTILFDIIVVATGFLLDENVSPEKTIRDVNMNHFREVFSVNTYVPALLAKYFLPRLQRDR